ncbi:hypothetical protein AURDEDRAFT_165735 [Auricularia subglabra TFB-10046 SS5]|nr:hypothetical protein AURDEDRAFT_165735 [Auricularia subglabra TFB-10046 SS5]
MTNSAFTSDQESALNALFAKQLSELTSLIKNNAPTAPPVTTAPTTAPSPTGAPADPTSATPAELRAATSGPAVTSAVPAAAHLAPGFALGAGAQDPLAGKQALLRFPGVDQAVLREIMLHTADFRTIAKLNPAYARSASEQVFAVSDGKLSIVNRSMGKSFPTLASLLASFSVYFDILCFQLGASRGFEAMWTLSHGWSLFQQQILQYHAIFEWNDLLNYIEQVYLRRRAEMMSGTFSGWWSPDHDLQSLYLHTPRARAPAAPTSSSSRASSSRPSNRSLPRSEQPCFLFLDGKCELTGPRHAP